MGSFNLNSTLSRILVEGDDDIVVFLCRRINRNIKTVVKPIGPPIKAKYYDYGRIKDIVIDDVVKHYEKYLGMDINTIIKCFNSTYNSSKTNIEGELEIILNNFKKLSLEGDRLELCMVIEHVSIYEAYRKEFYEIIEEFSLEPDKYIIENYSMEAIVNGRFSDRLSGIGHYAPYLAAEVNSGPISEGLAVSYIQFAQVLQVMYALEIDFIWQEYGRQDPRYQTILNLNKAIENLLINKLKDNE